MAISKGAALPLAILAASLLLLPQHGGAQFGSGDGFMPPPAGFGNFMPPPGGGGFGSPFATMPNVSCEQLNCAKGTCKTNSSSSHNGNSSSYSFSYSCQCEDGWSPSTGVFVPFAPCALPNCTATTNCSAAELPTPPKLTMLTNFSDPCSWAFCGGGNCVAESDVAYSCNCKTGYKNLFDNKIFPCYSDCSIGTQCKKQGVSFLNATAGTPGTGGDQGTGGSGSNRQGGGGANNAVPDSFLALLIITLSLVTVIA